MNTKFKELGIGKYQKNMNGVFTILMEYGNPKLAKYLPEEMQTGFKEDKYRDRKMMFGVKT